MQTKIRAEQTNLIDTIYPVGSIYMSVSSTNPGTTFGVGTWVAWGAGRVPVGVAGSGTFNTVEKTGGAETHTLTVTEMPGHNHDWGENNTTDSGRIGGMTNNGDFFGVSNASYPSGSSSRGGWATTLNFTGTNNNISRAGIKKQGGGSAHNNLQPYITCYMWKRTA